MSAMYCEKSQGLRPESRGQTTTKETVPTLQGTKKKEGSNEGGCCRHCVRSVLSVAKTVQAPTTIAENDARDGTDDERDRSARI